MFYPKFIVIRNSAFDLVFTILVRNISIASTGLMSLTTLRNRPTSSCSLGSSNNSSRRVPDAAISIAGQIRFSTNLRVRCNSELPVPLNSSKITSSALDPVSTSAVPMIVRDPPSSMLRAEPKNFFGRMD